MTGNKRKGKSSFEACFQASTLWLLLASPISAQSVPAEFNYSFVEADIKTALQIISTDTAQRINVDRAVSGMLKNVILSGSAADVFEDLSKEAELDWFLFDGIGYLSPEDRATTRLIRLGDLSFDRAMEALEDAKLLFERYPVRAAANGTAIIISGPAKLVGMIEALIESLPETIEVATDMAYVRERRGGVGLTLVPITQKGDLVHSRSGEADQVLKSESTENSDDGE